MAPLALLGSLISPVAKVFSERGERKRQKKQAEHEREIAHIKGDLDYNHAALAQESWKDGYLTVILTMPFLSFFIGTVFKVEGLVEGTEQFFVAMSGAPDWYQYSFLGMIVACYGLKGWSMHETLKRK